MPKWEEKIKEVMEDYRFNENPPGSANCDDRYTKQIIEVIKHELKEVREDEKNKIIDLLAQVEAKAYQAGRESVLEDINKMKKRVIQKSEEEQKKMSDSDYRYYLLSQETSQSYNDALRDVNQQIKQGKQ